MDFKTLSRKMIKLRGEQEMGSGAFGMFDIPGPLIFLIFSQ